MNNIEEMLTKAVEGVTRQFNAQVEASIAMLVNSGIPLERIELINRTADDLSVVTEVRSRTSDEAQAVATEREAIAGWHEGERDRCVAIQRDYQLRGLLELASGAKDTAHFHQQAAQAIRNGDHLKENKNG